MMYNFIPVRDNLDQRVNVTLIYLAQLWQFLQLVQMAAMSSSVQCLCLELPLLTSCITSSNRGSTYLGVVYHSNRECMKIVAYIT